MIKGRLPVSISHLKGIVLVACFLVTICFIYFLVVPDVQHADSTYSGQEVFLTQQSYDTFKSDIKARVYEDNLTLGSFNVLASEPPIIVSFGITTPYNYEFPYGKSRTHDMDVFLITILSLGIFLISVGLPSVLMFGGDEE